MRIEKTITTFLIVFGFLANALAGTSETSSGIDPLPSWQESANKKSITRFVEKVTAQGSTDYVVPSARIAVFDNDGTLWAEQPNYAQFFFMLDRIKQLAAQHPEWKTQEPFASVLKGDVKAALAGGEKALASMALTTHAGMTTDEFQRIAADWLASARNPVTHRLFMEMVYQPMLELLAYLRANGFKTYIVTGGGIDLVRAFAERVYGVPPEQVIGSGLQTKWTMVDGKPAIVRLPQIALIDDKEGKPLAIERFIGRRPVMAFGNSDGDLQMLQWTMSGPGPHFALIVHHTDAQREWAYDRQSRVGTLDKALDVATRQGWTIVDMKEDWRTIFPSEKSK